MVNEPPGLNDLQTKIEGKLKTIPVDSKKLNDVVSKFLKKLHKTLNMRVNDLENNIYDVTTLIHIDQSNNTDKQNLEKTIDKVEKRILDVSVLVTSTLFNTKIADNENKVQNTSDLVSSTVLNINIEATYFTISLILIIINLQRNLKRK